MKLAVLALALLQSITVVLAEPTPLLRSRVVDFAVSSTT
jgi:hypothetical protein